MSIIHNYNTQTKLFSLLKIGEGVIVLPFLDETEARRLHLCEEISYIVQHFPFYWRHCSWVEDLWRHHGITYYRPYGDNAVYQYIQNTDLDFQCGKYIGEYSERNDVIMCFMPTRKYFHFRITEQHYDSYILIDGVIYLMDIQGKLWLLDINGLKGPFRWVIDGGPSVKRLLPNAERVTDFMTRVKKGEEACNPLIRYQVMRQYEYGLRKSADYRAYLDRPCDNMRDVDPSYIEEFHRIKSDFLKSLQRVYDIYMKNQDSKDNYDRCEAIMKTWIPHVPSTSDKFTKFIQLMFLKLYFAIVDSLDESDPDSPLSNKDFVTYIHLRMFTMGRTVDDANDRDDHKCGCYEE